MPPTASLLTLASSPLLPAGTSNSPMTLSTTSTASTASGLSPTLSFLSTTLNGTPTIIGLLPAILSQPANVSLVTVTSVSFVTTHSPPTNSSNFHPVLDIRTLTASTAPTSAWALPSPDSVLRADSTSASPTTITLSIVVPVVGLIAIAFILWLGSRRRWWGCLRNARSNNPDEESCAEPRPTDNKRGRKFLGCFPMFHFNNTSGSEEQTPANAANPTETNNQVIDPETLNYTLFVAPGEIAVPTLDDPIGVWHQYQRDVLGRFEKIRYSRPRAKKSSKHLTAEEREAYGREIKKWKCALDAARLDDARAPYIRRNMLEEESESKRREEEEKERRERRECRALERAAWRAHMKRLQKKQEPTWKERIGRFLKI